MTKILKYNYLASVTYFNDQIKTVTSPSLRKLSRILDLSVNTVRDLLSGNPKCRTGREVSITRVAVL